MARLVLRAGGKEKRGGGELNEWIHRVHNFITECSQGKNVLRVGMVGYIISLERHTIRRSLMKEKKRHQAY